MENIIVAEADPAAVCVIETTLHQHLKSRVILTGHGYSLLDLLEREKVSLIMFDVSLPGIAGVDLLRIIQRKFPNIPVILIVGTRDEGQVKTMLENGALDYIRKSDSPAHIAAAVTTALKREQDSSLPHKAMKNAFGRIIGASAVIQTAIEQARKAAESDIPVLLKGESGVGKELFAEAIHESGGRSGKPFVAVNCGAIPINLVESALFGHVKGAFTGATESAIGKFREADGGTLFLDEVGELPLETQVKLLRAIQEKEVQPVGGGKPVKVNIRIISATHVNLEQSISTSRFREDLYYRLNVFPIDIPALRQRGHDDICALANHYLKYYAKSEAKNISRLNDAATSLICGYSWPGNVRQLQNAIHRAVVLAKSDALAVEDFTLLSAGLQQQYEPVRQPFAIQPARAAEIKEDEKMNVTLTNSSGEFRPLKEIESEILNKAVMFYRWKISAVARALGVTRATIYKKMEAAGIGGENNVKAGNS